MRRVTRECRTIVAKEMGNAIYSIGICDSRDFLFVRWRVADERSARERRRDTRHDGVFVARSGGAVPCVAPLLARAL